MKSVVAISDKNVVW